MKEWRRRWGWTVVKTLLALAILAGIGRQFYLNLSRLDLAKLSLRPGWMLLSAGLYIGGIGGSAWFWYRLLRVFGERPAVATTVRAYYIGHLGKYVPGKAWALLLRGDLVRGPGVRLGVAIIASFYEVLTTMAAAALLSAVLFALDPPTAAGLSVHPAVGGVLLLGLVGVPLLPGVFNLLVRRLAQRFQNVESFRLPRLGIGTLAQGLLVTGACWFAMSASLWAMVQAMVAQPQPLTPESWGQYTAMLGLSYVAGFLAVVLPSGVGVREGVLDLFLGPQLAAQMPEGRAVATAVVLMLRLLWTTAELVVAGVVYWLPGPRVPAVGQDSNPDKDLSGLES